MPSSYAARQSEFTRNLLTLCQQATDADIEQGLAWYPSVHRLICNWADTYRQPIQVVANVVAAISPQCFWERNLIIADDILAGRPPSIGALHSNVRKAEAILRNREFSVARYFPHGPKVQAFAANLAYDLLQVTVDTHGQQAALADVETRDSMHPVRYHIIADAYKHAAASYRLAPATFQAIIWHVWKRLYPRIDKLQRRRQWHVIGIEE